MVYWLEKVQQCPKDSHPFDRPDKYVHHSCAEDTRIAVYVCPECGNTYLQYPGAEIASRTETSVTFLSLCEWDRVRRLRKART